MPIAKKVKRGRPPKPAYPMHQEIFYTNVLLDMVNSWGQSVINLVFPALKPMIDDHKFQTRTDAWSAMSKQVIEALGIAMNAESIKAINFLDEIGQSTANHNSVQWRRVTRSIVGVPFISAQPWVTDYINSWVNDNVALIKKLQADTLQNIELIVNTGIKEGASIRTIKKQLLEGQLVKTRNRAELIAADQIGKFNGELTKTNQESVGVTLYIWRDSDDSRVRLKHSVMDGKYCKWSDPTVYADTLEEAQAGKWKSRSSINGVLKHPGMDFRCRCWADAVFEGLI